MDSSHFIDEHNVPIGNPLVRVEFDDPFGKLKPVIDVRAVIRVQYRHFRKHFGKVVMARIQFVIEPVERILLGDELLIFSPSSFGILYERWRRARNIRHGITGIKSPN